MFQWKFEKKATEKDLTCSGNDLLSISLQLLLKAKESLMDLQEMREHDIRQAIKDRWADQFGGKFEGWELTAEELKQAVLNVIFDSNFKPEKTIKDSVHDQCEFLWEMRRQTSDEYMNEPHDKGCNCDYHVDNLPECEERDEIR